MSSGCEVVPLADTPEAFSSACSSDREMSALNTRPQRPQRTWPWPTRRSLAVRASVRVQLGQVVNIAIQIPATLRCRPSCFQPAPSSRRAARRRAVSHRVQRPSAHPAACSSRIPASTSWPPGRTRPAERGRKFNQRSGQDVGQHDIDARWQRRGVVMDGRRDRPRHWPLHCRRWRSAPAGRYRRHAHAAAPRRAAATASTPEPQP